MPVHAQADPASAILSEIPRLRAYARLMTNGRSEADRQVEDMLESVLADDLLWSDRPQLRVRLFKILRGYLACGQCSMLQRDILNSYGNLYSSHAATGAANSDAQTVKDVDVLHLGYFDILHNQNSGALAPFTHAGTFRQTSYLEAVFSVHGETREYFQ
jgi:response regulator PhyR-like protein